MQSIRLLFETQEAAREVAFMLRCEYDGCNMVTLPSVHDTLALKTAIGLVGADFCFDGDHYPLVLPLPSNELTQSKADQLTERISQKMELWLTEAPF
jgi:hypothetical protein